MLGYHFILISGALVLFYFGVSADKGNGELKIPMLIY